MVSLKRKVTLRRKAPVGTASTPPSTPNSGASSGRRWGWIVGLGLLLVGGLVYSFGLKSDKSSEVLTVEAQAKIEGLNIDSLLKKELNLEKQQIAEVVEHIRKDSLFLSISHPKGLAEDQITEQTVSDLWRDLEAAVIAEAGKRLALTPEQLAVSTFYSSYTAAPQATETIATGSAQDTLATISVPADTLPETQGKASANFRGQAVSSSSEAQLSSISCFFLFDSTQPSDVQDLKAWAQKLRGRSKHITIASYADVTGGSRYNLDLSKRRAEAIRQILLSEGIAATRISLKAMGETERFGVKSQNRRADLVLD